MRLSSHLRIAFALFLGILLISNFTTLSSADVQVNASVTNVAPVISAISDHTPNITSALNTESNPSSPMSGTGTVTFNVSWTDANGDSGRLFVCNGAMNSGNTSCASETYCSNSTYHASGTTISCVNVTNSGMPYTNNYNVFIVDNQTSPLASTASAGTFFVGSGAGISGVLLEELGGDGGSFEIGDSINCSATLSDSAETAPNVTVRIMGPMGTLDDPDFTLQYTSYNLAGCESSGSWSTGRFCNWTWAIPISGTTEAGTCRAPRGTWNCTINVTSLMAVQTAISGDEEQMDNTGPSSVANIAYGTSCPSGGSNPPISPGSSFRICANVTDPNGADDINATGCSSNMCSAICWAGTGGSPTYAEGTWDTRYSDSESFVAAAISGCQWGGWGSKRIEFLVSSVSKSLNGTWTCRINSTDTSGSSATSSTNQQDLIDVSPGAQAPATSVGWSSLTPSAAVNWVPTDTGGSYVEITHEGNWINDYVGGFWGNLSTSCSGSGSTDPSPYIDVTNYLRVEGNNAGGGAADCTDGSGHWTPPDIRSSLDRINGMQDITRGNPSTQTSNTTRMYFCIDVPSGVPAGTYRRTIQLYAEIDGQDTQSLNAEC